MRTPKALKARLNRLLSRQKLDDFTQYSRPDFFDEVPFYSRYREIAFLEEFGRDITDKVLLGLGLDYLDALVEFKRSEGSFFAALTVDRFDRTSPIVPRIFACQGSLLGSIRGRLLLSAPKTLLSRRIKSLLNSLDASERFRMFEDFLTVPESPRVFIGHRGDLVPGFLTIDELAGHAGSLSRP